MDRPQVTLLGSYGLDSDHNYVSETKFKEFVDPGRDFNFNLLEGYTGNNDDLHQSWAKRDKMGNATKWMVEHHSLVSDPGSEKVFNVDFVCGSGMIKRVLNSPFDYPIDDPRFKDDDKTAIKVSKYNGVIFINQYDHEEDSTTSNNESTYAGYKFEELLTRKVDPDDRSETCYKVMKAKVGNHSILYSCESDCIKGGLEAAPTLDNFIELKTSFDIKNHSFRTFRSRRWWAQAYMSGTKEIVVGIKDRESLHCQEIQKVSTSNLEANANGWKPSIAFEMLIKFLDRVKEVVTEDNPDIAYRFVVSGGGVISEPEVMDATASPEFRVVTSAMIEKMNELN